jgi:hypothetical protein
MRDLDIGQKDNQHPTHPRGLLDERYGYKREDLKEYLEPLREAFYKGFQDFVVAAEPLLRDGDCLVVANELPIDLGYEFDEYDQVYLRETFLLRELLLFARTALGEKKVELTYAALDPYELSESDWKELKEAGLDFASINRYWSKDDQGNAEGLAQVLAILHERCPNVPIAITECGALTCLQAQTFDGDGGQVNVGTLEEYRIGEEMQEMGIVELMGRIKDDPNTGRRYVASNGTNIPIRGVFLFAWDETMDTGFGLVRTNCMPVSWDQKGNPYVPQDGQTWQTGCLYRTGNYVPVGKRALQWVPVFFGSKQSPMEVVLRTDPATQAKVKGVEICWPSNFEPSKDLDPFIECKTGPYCTLLLYTLRQGSDEKGKVIWGKSGKTDEESESFWCADDARNYWVRAWWEDGSKGEWINLAPKTPDEQRTNKVTVTIKFGQ